MIFFSNKSQQIQAEHLTFSVVRFVIWLTDYIVRRNVGSHLQGVTLCLEKYVLSLIKQIHKSAGKTIGNGSPLNQ